MVVCTHGSFCPPMVRKGETVKLSLKKMIGCCCETMCTSKIMDTQPLLPKDMNNAILKDILKSLTSARGSKYRGQRILPGQIIG